jgi:hypothetical protein
LLEADLSLGTNFASLEPGLSYLLPTNPELGHSFHRVMHGIKPQSRL